MADYPFYSSRSQITKTPKQSFVSDFSAMSDYLYPLAPNYFGVDDEFPVEHEVTYGQNDFEPIATRVDSVVESGTNKNVGDDYKNFILLPSADKVFIGKKFKWKDNYWIATNTNTYESLTNGCAVRRCNHVLKWIDNNGVLQIEPCAIGYDITRPNDFNNGTTVLNAGEIYLYCQRNERTNLILPNRRFLIGTKENVKAYKIYGDGINNYLNTKTEDNTSPCVLEIKMVANYDNSENDDNVNGIADAYINTYTISIDQDNIAQSIGFTTTLTAKTYKDGALTTDSVLWSSGSPLVCTVNSSGVINCLSNGSAVITASLAKNPLIKSTITIAVSASPAQEWDIRITPNIYNIFEGTTQSFDCRLYLNEVVQSGTFAFSIIGVIPPSYCYTFATTSGNSFSIKNNRMSLTPLVVRCTSGTHTQDFSFTLKGVF